MVKNFGGSDGPSFSPEEFKRQRRRQKRLAYGCLGFGIVVLFDSFSPFPIPLVGLPSVIIGSLITLYGWWQWQRYKEPPLHAAVSLAFFLGGEFTRTDFFLLLGLSPRETDQLIAILISEGFVERQDSTLSVESEVIYRLVSKSQG